MSIWHDRGMSSGPGGRKPRFIPLMVALSLGALLLFNVATGHIDLTSAFDDNAMDSMRAERAAIAATVIAYRTATAGDQAALVAASPTATAPTPAPAAAPPACEPSGDDRFCLYTVEPGDSLASIADRFGLDGGLVPGWELIFESNQPDLGSMDDLLQLGMVLRIPSSNGVIHLLMPGESMSGLAVDYDVTTEDIVAANALADPDNVQIGDIVFVPEPGQLPPDPVIVEDEPAEPEETAEAEPAVEEEDTAEDLQDEEGVPEETTEPEDDQDAAGQASSDEASDDEQSDDADTPGSEDEPGDERDGPNASEQRREAGNDNNFGDRDEEREQPEEPRDGEDEESETPSEPEREPTPEPESPEPAPDDPSHMSWPVGLIKITNYMTARHPLGLDFGLGAAPRSPILAAAAGTVSFAGGDPCCSYGYYVIVDHGNGLQTLYGHFSSISVRKGETVGRGEVLGIAGDTGNAYGVHLHFEVHKNGSRVDPMNYLPN